MQKKKAISLIVLVITIIVMIVLAGAIILSLNNSGIIGKANQAVRDTDEATVKELAQMAWAEAYAAGVRHVEGDGGLQERVEKALQDNGVDTTETSKYLINVTEKGVTTKLKTNAWIQGGLTVKRGGESLTIGQTVAYDEGVSTYTGGWKVLGADADGNLLIMSDVDVATVTLGGSNITAAHSSWKTGANDITKACQEAIPVAGRNNAISVRSIEVEDIDKVTGFNPKDTNSTDEIETPYAHKNIHEYGNTVTYSYNGTTYPAYIGTNGVTGDLTKDHSEKGFYWSDGKGLYCVEASHLTNADNIAKEDKILTESTNKATIASNYYWYYPTTLTTSLSEEIKGIEKTTDAYKMLFRNGDDTANVNYWLASPYVGTYSYYVDFGMRGVAGGIVSIGSLFRSYGYTNTPTYGARAVVTLESTVSVSSLVD